MVIGVEMKYLKLYEGDLFNIEKLRDVPFIDVAIAIYLTNTKESVLVDGNIWYYNDKGKQDLLSKKNLKAVEEFKKKLFKEED